MEPVDFGLSKNLTDRLRACYDTWDAENLYESGWSSPDNFPADTGCVCMKPINIGKPSLLDGKDDGRRFLKGSFGEVNEGAPPLPPRTNPRSSPRGNTADSPSSPIPSAPTGTSDCAGYRPE